MAKREYRLKPTKFAEEAASKSMAISTELASQIFVAGTKGGIDESKIERLNLPRLLKPENVPVWTEAAPLILAGEIVKVCPSPNSAIKGFVLWLKLQSGAEITFPCTGVVRSALAPGCKIDDKSPEAEERTTKALGEALRQHEGKTLYLKRTANQMNKNYKREMFMFDVWLSKK